DLLGDGLGKADHAGLRGGGVGLTGIAYESCDAADADYAAPALADHWPDRRLRHAERALEVVVDHAIPLRLRHTQDQIVRRDAGIVDENVDLAECLHRRVHEGRSNAG